VTGEIWTLSVDSEHCGGTGLCVGRAPELFQLGPDRRAHAVHTQVASDDAVVDAAECCPMEAIRVVDTTGRLLYPEDL
jgi:ferredoxin